MQGQITSIDETGRTIVLQPDEWKTKSFFDLINCIAAGRDELKLLLHSNHTLEGVRMRDKDNRSDVQLKEDWLAKVTKAGMRAEAAEAWLETRIRIYRSDAEFANG